MFSNSGGSVGVSDLRLRRETTASRENEKISIKRMKMSHIFIIVIILFSVSGDRNLQSKKGLKDKSLRPG